MRDKCYICESFNLCSSRRPKCKTPDLPAFKLDRSKDCGNCYNNDQEICSAADGAEGVPTDIGGFGGPCMNWKPK